MKVEEYDAFIRDPADFILRTFFPRSVGAFAGFRNWAPSLLLLVYRFFILLSLAIQK